MERMQSRKGYGRWIVLIDKPDWQLSEATCRGAIADEPIINQQPVMRRRCQATDALSPPNIPVPREGGNEGS